MPIIWTHKIAFQLYDLGWRLALPWLRHNSRLAEGYDQRILQEGLPPADIWIQAASVGESLLAVELVHALVLRRPATVLVTSGTRQGVDILSRNFSGPPGINKTRVGYFPFDRPGLMQAAVGAIRPAVMVLLETEIWPGLLQALKKFGSRVLIVNGRMTQKSLKRYLLLPSVWQSLKPDKILAVSPADAKRFVRLFGRQRVAIMPNMKFDRLAAPAAGKNASAALQTLLPSRIPFVVLASVRREEEALVANMIRQVLNRSPRTVIGLFPRHMHRVDSWQQRLHHAQIPCCLRSKLSGPADAGTVVVWDTIGELSAAYRLAAAAFVGGSLAPLGGQNFLEALAGGVIPVTGPWWDNFAWVGTQITDSGLLKVAADWRQAADRILENLAIPVQREHVTEQLRQFINAHRGGTATACGLIADFLENNRRAR
jgi:3-deoxy-D-manno-octulosonic-acid transferase